MSDFIFFSKQIPKGKPTWLIKSIYQKDAPNVTEYHGNWGSLGVSCNMHQGFSPVETDKYICLLIGGPIFTFTDNGFLVNNDSTYGTRKILHKWINNDDIRWDEDLSGPFIAVLINKETSQIEIVTDLMSFIPVFSTTIADQLVVGTHVDIVASGAECKDEKDSVSIADFVLHGYVTYPYTFYKSIHQLSPASVHKWNLRSNTTYEKKYYWRPTEYNPYKSINHAASDLRNGLYDYVNAVTTSMNHVALFLSGGEDSRVVLSLLPKKCKKDAFIFLDKMNREGQIAKKVAEVFEANFIMASRTSTRYLDVLPECSDLVGSGSQYTHVHTFGFHENCGLNQYRAVFGGFSADALLKGSHVKKLKGSGLVPFVPKIKQPRFSHASLLNVGFLSKSIVQSLEQRSKKHREWICKIRPNSADEWFELWPSSMNFNIPNLHGNRRLFCSYEPFMSNKVVKIAAAVPQSWKLNRRLFYSMAKPLLKPARHIAHSDGWLPYYPWYMNFFIHGLTWSWRKILKKTGLQKGYQGPWRDWDALLRTDAWKNAVKSTYGLREKHLLLQEIFLENMEELLIGNKLNRGQKINLLQVLYQLEIKRI
jgi:asparagine synthetase B (glutamine-hydrolysing)